MRKHQHARFLLPHAVAAAALVVGMTAASGDGFARGGGGSHGSSFHSSIAPGSAIRSAPSQMYGGTPPAAHTPASITTPTSASETSRHESPQHEGHDAGHHHHPGKPPPSGGTGSTGSTTTTVVVPDTSAQPAPFPDVAPAAIEPEIAVTPPASQISTPATVQTSGGTLSPVNTGGGGDTLVACMALWDVGTHMTKVEWRDTCVRTLNGMDVGGGVTAEAGHGARTEQASHARRTAVTARVIRQRHRTTE